MSQILDFNKMQGTKLNRDVLKRRLMCFNHAGLSFVRWDVERHLRANGWKGTPHKAPALYFQKYHNPELFGGTN